MKPPPFSYHAPRTLDEALGLLGDKPNARLLAGGQSLMPMLNMRLTAPDHLIDLNTVAGLSSIREEAGEIVFGAMARQRDIEFSALVGRSLPLMAEAIRFVGHRQTRNRGTIGGSLCHLDPSAELPTVAMAMDATLRLQSRRGSRTLAMSDFPAGYMTPAIEPDEILTEIRLRPWASGHGWAFTEFSRRHGDFAIVSAAALVEMNTNGRIARAALTLGGVGPAPVRVREAEALLLGAHPGPDLPARSAAPCGSIDAIEDPQYPSSYRQKLAVTLSRRALETALARATKS